MIYDIAGEYAAYDPQKAEIRERFEKYLANGGRCSDDTIFVNLEGLAAYREAHRHLPESQCELLFSMQQFFIGLLQKQKVLLHASAVVIDGLCYIFTGAPNAGKTTLSQHLAAHHANACILSDDRTVIGLADGALCAWGTPWSKTGSGPGAAVPVQSVIYLVPAAANAVEEISTDEMRTYCVNLYPADLRQDISRILRLLFEHIRLYLLKSGMSYFDPALLYGIISQ